jgi:uncharacterized protein (DUF58 family)
MAVFSRRRPASPVERAEAKGKALGWFDKARDVFAPERIRSGWLNFQRAIGLTRAGQVGVLVAVILWLVAFLVAGTALYIIAYGSFFLVVASYVLAQRRPKLEATREGLYPRAQQGDRLEVNLSLTAQRGVSTLVLEERVPERLGNTVKVPISKLSRDKHVEHSYSLRCSRRGVYDVGPLVAVTSDPLGLTQRETVIAEEFEMMVHPRIEVVSDRPLTRQFEDPPIRPPVSKPWPSGLEFYGMREYQPGDDVRRIVWRASARVGKLMVREAEQGITDHITMILDTDRSTHSRDGFDYSESFEVGVRAAASLAVRHLRDGYEVRVETNSGPLIRPARGQDQQVSVLDSFSRVELGRDPLSKVIMRLIGDPRRDAHNVLITPYLGRTEAAQLRILLNKGVSIFVIALLWEEEHADTLNTAAALGCQVAGVHPGQDLSSALYHDIGAGNR